jgi:hypothetical protein
MITIDLKEHTLYDGATEPAFGINYQGAGTAFLDVDNTEPLQYCEDLDREEVQDLFNKPDEYFFGKVTLNLEFEQSPSLGRGKQAMWFAKYFKSGYYEEPFE